MYKGAKKAGESGKWKGEGVRRAEKEDRKCEAHNGVADGTGQEETGLLTVQKAVFRDLLPLVNVACTNVPPRPPPKKNT